MQSDCERQNRPSSDSGTDFLEKWRLFYYDLRAIRNNKPIKKPITITSPREPVKQIKEVMKKRALFIISIAIWQLLLPIGTHALNEGGKNRIEQKVRNANDTSFERNTIKQRQNLTPSKVPAALRSAGKNVEILGSVVYSNLWDPMVYPQPYGIYSYLAAADMKMELVDNGAHIWANGGGAYKDGNYYFVNYTRLPNGYTFGQVSKYDAESWELLSQQSLTNYGVIATDVAYDPLTGNIYGCFRNDTQTGYCLGYVNYEDQTREQIADYGTDIFFVGMATDHHGDLYGVGNNGNMYKIDKETGTYTLIGNTGVNLAASYAQTACGDPRSGRLFWSAYLNDGTSALYELDKTTGEATMIAFFEGSEQIVGSYIVPITANPDAPDDLEQFSLSFNEASLKGTALLSMPSQTFSGETLEGELAFTIVMDGDETVAQGTSTAGSTVDCSVEVSEPGMHTFTAYASNTEGDGPKSKYKVYVGYDTPTAVTELLLSNDGNGLLTLTWKAPETSVHGGYLDAVGMSYDIVRFPDNSIVAEGLKATVFSEIFQPELLNSYWYEVTAVSQGLRSETVQSEKIVLGQHVVPPYTEGFDVADNFSLFTIIDANSDGFTWQWSYGIAQYPYNWQGAGDDWMITPPVHLTADRMFTFTFDAYNSNSNYTEKMAVCYGESNDVEGMTVELLPPTEFKDGLSKKMKFNIKVEKEGDYYFGFHALSQSNMYGMCVDNISVQPGAALVAPQAPTLTAEAAAEGRLSVDVSIGVPSEKVNGDELNSLEKIELYRGNILLTTFVMPTPGSTLSYTDEGVGQGINNYLAVAYNEEGGKGIDGETSVYAGIDIPTPPTNVQLKDMGDYVLLSWDAPTTGVNGGYVNPAALTYNVVNSYGYSMAWGVEGLSLELRPEMTGAQSYLVYGVAGQSTAGSGDIGRSNNIVIGDAYTLPFKESFPSARSENAFWGIPGSYCYSISNEVTYDGDGGSIQFSTTIEGEESILQSGKIDISTAANPLLEFYFYKDIDEGVQLKAEIWTSESDSCVVYNSESVETDGEWVKVSVHLNEFTNSRYVHLVFRCKSFDGETPLVIDRISIRDDMDHNLAATISAPTKVNVGETGDIVVTVVNEGSKKAEGFDVDIVINDIVAATIPGNDMEPEAIDSYVYHFVPNVAYDAQSEIYAVVNYPLDENLSNNTTETVLVTVPLPTLPTVNCLEGRLEGNNVVITWEAPDYEAGSSEPVTEGFEDYSPFIIDAIGDWTLVDVDGSVTYGITMTNNYDNNRQPMAFQVFNPTLAGLDITMFPIYAPHSGEQYLAALNDTDGQDDDWLISPLLSGGSQTVSFFLRSCNNDFGYEKYQLYYSTEGNNVSDFVSYDNLTHEAPTAWTEVVMTLPENTKYFAIRCVSTNSFMFMIDDITYVPANNKVQLSLKGYNVYRDGVLVNSEPLNDTNYTEEWSEFQTHTYSVSAVYDLGESAAIGRLMFDPATVGISSIASASHKFKCANGNLYITHTGSSSVSVLTPSGIVLHRGIGDAVVALPAGERVVILMIDNKAYKVWVR